MGLGTDFRDTDKTYSGSRDQKTTGSVSATPPMLSLYIVQCSLSIYCMSIYVF
jgi:hypothetical protein